MNTAPIGTATLIATRTVVALEYNGKTWPTPAGTNDVNLFDFVRGLGLTAYSWGFRGTADKSTVVVVALRGGAGAYDRAVAKLRRLGCEV